MKVKKTWSSEKRNMMCYYVVITTERDKTQMFHARTALYKIPCFDWSNLMYSSVGYCEIHVQRCKRRRVMKNSLCFQYIRLYN